MWREAIIWTNDGLYSIGLIATSFMKIESAYKDF